MLIVFVIDGGQIVAADDLIYLSQGARLPPDGRIEIPAKYLLGRYEFGFSGIWSGMACLDAYDDRFRPPIDPNKPVLFAKLIGPMAGDHGIGLFDHLQEGDLLWCGDRYRRIGRLTPTGNGTQGTVQLEDPAEARCDLPQLQGMLWGPGEFAILWGAGGYLRELRRTSADSDQWEAVVDYWDRPILPLGYTPPTKVLILTEGTEISVPSRKDPNRVAGKFRCHKIHLPMPDCGFSGGVDLVPVGWIIIIKGQRAE